jgi:uncharacterized protein YecT (DUF1311 family)
MMNPRNSKAISGRGLTRTTIIFLLPFLLAGGDAAGQRKKAADPCVDPDNQAQMNQCAGKAFRAADAAMTKVYRKLVALLTNAEQAQLKEAQTTWLRYRDANCEFVADEYKGGSIRPLILASCLADMTRKRTSELKSQIKERTF